VDRSHTCELWVEYDFGKVGQYRLRLAVLSARMAALSSLPPPPAGLVTLAAHVRAVKVAPQRATGAGMPVCGPAGWPVHARYMGFMPLVDSVTYLECTCLIVKSGLEGLGQKDMVL
jgi:hypothetical protein